SPPRGDAGRGQNAHLESRIVGKQGSRYEERGVLKSRRNAAVDAVFPIEPMDEIPRRLGVGAPLQYHALLVRLRAGYLDLGRVGDLLFVELLAVLPDEKPLGAVRIGNPVVQHLG